MCFCSRSRPVRTSMSSGGWDDERNSAANGALNRSVAAVRSGRDFRLCNPSFRYPAT